MQCGLTDLGPTMGASAFQQDFQFSVALNGNETHGRTPGKVHMSDIWTTHAAAENQGWGKWEVSL